MFEGRNRRYGAYYLRKIYPRNVLIGFIAAILLFILALLTPYIVEWIKDLGVSDKDFTIISVSDLPPPPQILTPISYQPPIEIHDIHVLPKVSQDNTPAAPKPKPQKPKAQPPPTTKGTPSQTGGNNQGPDTTAVSPNIGDIHIMVDVPPQFPGGLYAMKQYIKNNMHYPNDDVRKGHEGRVVIQMIINADGSLSNIKVISGVTSTIDNEALRLVKGMPRWQPGLIKNHPIRVLVRLPIRFSLNK